MGGEQDPEKGMCSGICDCAAAGIPGMDCTDPNAPLCSCMNLNLEKSGLFSVENNSMVCMCMPSYVCKVFVIAADLFMTPFIMAFHFMRIYFVPAVMSVFTGLIEKFICTLACCGCHFTDSTFPPIDLSIGYPDTVTRRHIFANLDMWQHGFFYYVGQLVGCYRKNKYEWARCPELEHGSDGNTNIQEDDQAMKLFSGEIEPSDIAQGALGDCWLLASLAAVAEKHSHLISSAYLTSRASVCGLYRIKVYDVFNGTPKWTVYTIDDFVPVENGTKRPKFCKPHGGEMWVLLMEKVFAKMMGGYEELKGGYGRVPFRALTGNDPIEYSSKKNYSTGIWEFDAFRSDDAGEGHDRAPSLTENEMYRVISGSIRHGCIVCAGSGGGSDKTSSHGIVNGHMYSLLNTCRVDGEKVIQIRNPWGGFEWTGKYSDNDASTQGWKPDGGVLDFLVPDMIDGGGEKLRGEKGDDGVFWMPFSDFIEHFDYFCFCAVSENMNSLNLDVHEDMGTCGPCYGCLEGAASYCLMCQGAQHLWCPQKRSTMEIVCAYKEEGGTLRAMEKCMRGD